ncbi:MAG: putative Ig domain-containing protein [Planctomycetota bacterium]
MNCCTLTARYGSLLVLAAFAFLAIASFAPADAAAQPKVLLLGSADQGRDPQAEFDDITAYLEATGKFGGITTFDCSSSVPTIDELNQYDGVLVWTTQAPSDPKAIGNVLQEYLAGGGGVLEMSMTFTATNGIHGNWDNVTTIDSSGDNMLFDDGLDFGKVYDDQHPTVIGIGRLDGGLRRQKVTDGFNGATVIATWSDDNVCVCVNEEFGGRLAGINMAPWSRASLGAWDPADSENDELIAQSLEWVCGGGAGPALAITAPAAGALPDGYITEAYPNTNFTAAGGTQPYTWSSDTLPDGLTLAPDSGVLDGTPTTAGNTAFDVTVTDDNAANDSRNYNITIYALPAITGPGAGALAVGSTGSPYGPVNVTGTGGKAAIVWSISAGALPTGLSINSNTGAISGTPSAVGNFNFTVRMADANNRADTRAYSILITDLPVITSPSAGALADGYDGVSYPQVTFTATGGAGGYVWSLFSGSLPTGMSLSAAGVLDGTPSGIGSFSFQVRVTDSNSDTDTKSYTLDILTVPSISSPTPGALPQGTQNAPTAYAVPTLTFTGTGGKAPLSWSATNLPAGITINSSSGVVSGTPTASGNFNIVVTVTDANSQTGNGNYTLTINPPVQISGTTLPSGELDTAYDQTVGITGGTAAFSFSMTIDPPIATLSINTSTGQITGTLPEGAGNYTVNVTVTDAYGSTTNKDLTLTVTSPSGSGLGGSCGCNGRATGTDESFNLWLALLLPLLMLLVRRRNGLH